MGKEEERQNIKFLIVQKNMKIKFLKEEIRLLKTGLPLNERQKIKLTLLPLEFLQEKVGGK